MQQVERGAPPEQVVYRQLAIPVAAFDGLKDKQRDIERTTGTRPTLARALAIIVAEHKALSNAARGVRTDGEEAAARR